jgi:hypothetical protein
VTNWAKNSLHLQKFGWHQVAIGRFQVLHSGRRGINADMGVVPLIEMLYSLSHALLALFPLAMDADRLIARDLPIA